MSNYYTNYHALNVYPPSSTSFPAIEFSSTSLPAIELTPTPNDVTVVGLPQF